MISHCTKDSWLCYFVVGWLFQFCHPIEIMGWNTWIWNCNFKHVIMHAHKIGWHTGRRQKSIVFLQQCYLVLIRFRKWILQFPLFKWFRLISFQAIKVAFAIQLESIYMDVRLYFMVHWSLWKWFMLREETGQWNIME